jgi:cobalt-zinc-cadmium efflux system protein
MNPEVLFLLVLAAMLLSLVLLILVGSQVLHPPVRQQKSITNADGPVANQPDMIRDLSHDQSQKRMRSAIAETLSTAGKNMRKLAIVLGLTATYMVAEVIGGLMTNTHALLADAKHMLADLGTLGLMLLAIWFVERSATREKTYGHYRAGILAALINATALFFVSVYILYEAWERVQNPPEVMSWPVLIIATIGLGVNLVSLWLLADASVKSPIIRAAYLQVFGDLVGALGVIAASVFMLTTQGFLADPIISAGIGLFIILAGIVLFVLPEAWTVLRQLMHLLMKGAPTRVDLKGEPAHRSGLRSAASAAAVVEGVNQNQTPDRLGGGDSRNGEQLG